MINHEIA